MKIKDEVDIWAEQQARFAKDGPVPPTRLVTHYHAAGETATNCVRCSDERNGQRPGTR